MKCTLDDLRKLSAELGSIPDDRPDWLRALPSASDEHMTQFARYYRFFHEFVKRFRPLSVLEIGTYKGTSAAHLAFAAPKETTVVTLDVDPSSCTAVQAFGLKNIIPVTGDSAASAEALEFFGPYDVLFIDAQHDFEHCRGEYLRYRQMVNPGGVIFFDDIHYGSEMEQAWVSVEEPKVELPELHYTGFGACAVLRPEEWQESQ